MPADFVPAAPEYLRIEALAMAPLLLLMVWMGTFTESFLPPIHNATAAILERSKIGVDFQVLERSVRPEVADAR